MDLSTHDAAIDILMLVLILMMVRVVVVVVVVEAMISASPCKPGSYLPAHRAFPGTQPHTNIAHTLLVSLILC